MDQVGQLREVERMAAHRCNAHTVVTWRIHFEPGSSIRRGYFAPVWERAAVRQAAGFLIEANATPVRREP